MADSHLSTILATIRSEHDSQGSLATKIDMSEFEIATVESFVQFLYTGDYANVKQETQNEDDGTGNLESELLGHLRCHKIALLYEVMTMECLARSKIDTLLQDHRDSSDLVSALPGVIETAHSLSVGQNILDSLALSAAHNLLKLSREKMLSRISQVPEFLVNMLQHVALNFVQLETRHKSELQKIKENREKSIQTMKGSVSRLSAICINPSCSNKFGGQMDITDELAVKCRFCGWIQKPLSSSSGLKPSFAFGPSSSAPKPMFQLGMPSPPAQPSAVQPARTQLFTFGPKPEDGRNV
ncbi:hypothetical protein PWT90_09200 [Aphanocladium album]|nr:hypothetical protein PWT90_09200 [Aphanocladium album]